MGESKKERKFPIKDRKKKKYAERFLDQTISFYVGRRDPREGEGKKENRETKNETSSPLITSNDDRWSATVYLILCTTGC